MESGGLAADLTKSLAVFWEHDEAGEGRFGGGDFRSTSRWGETGGLPRRKTLLTFFKKPPVG